ncbi:MAG: AAA family ATPase [Deltaproteobacteria bacterium]|nr:AAA family ATPase [Deltaproteobacteria bacterium]
MTGPFADRKVVVAVGTGGVGKTTVSAALAIAAAASGRRTLVMTIDPARRLAHALGVADHGNVEREIEPERLRAAGIVLQAPLWVMAPDVKRTFDEIVARAPLSEEKRQQVFNNRIYQHFSSALAGSHEYAAVQKLYEVYKSGRYDLIVLDTPPAQNAADFLDAPGRVLDFLENETLQWLLRPYVGNGLPFKVLDIGSSFFWRTLGGMAGGDTLRELAEFILSFRGMYDGFRERSRQVSELLASDALAFVLVTTTSLMQQRAMWHFKEELRAQGLAVRAVIVNRVRAMPAWDQQAAGRAGALLSRLDPEVAAEVERAAREEWVLAEADLRAVRELEARLGGVPVTLIHERPTDVHDLFGLANVASTFL